MTINGLKQGYTTGACAAAAAKAAAMVLSGRAPADLAEVMIRLPDQQVVSLPLAYVRREGDTAAAAVVKDAGDDPDVTHGAMVVACVCWSKDEDVSFVAGEGVGTVTKPGLSIPPGEPAINPVPRSMIRDAVREVTQRGVRVEIAIPGGRELAQKTFNQRLGIQGGLSILGTSGRVRPFSHEAVQSTVACALDVADAGAVRQLVLTPGRIGERAARRHLKIAPEGLVEVSNEWGFALERLSGRSFEKVLLVGHPGKLAKLADGNFQTHSGRSPSAVAYLLQFGAELLGHSLPADCTTTEGLMVSLIPWKQRRLADALAGRIARAAEHKIGPRPTTAVLLVNLRGDKLGAHGELSPWL